VPENRDRWSRPTAKSLNLDVQLNLGTDKTIVAILGSNTGQLSTDLFAVLPGVESVTRIMKPYKLASREFKAEDSIVSIGGIKIGGKRIVVMAGPVRSKVKHSSWKRRK